MRVEIWQTVLFQLPFGAVPWGCNFGKLVLYYHEHFPVPTMHWWSGVLITFTTLIPVFGAFIWMFYRTFWSCWSIRFRQSGLLFYFLCLATGLKVTSFTQRLLVGRLDCRQSGYWWQLLWVEVWWVLWECSSIFQHSLSNSLIREAVRRDCRIKQIPREKYQQSKENG